MDQFNVGDLGEFESSWNCTGRYPRIALNELIKTFLEEYKSSILEYERIISNDGKLVGNEKIEMIRRLTEMLFSLVYAKNLINKNYAKNKYSNSNLNISFRNEMDFIIRGKLDISRKQKLSSFGDWQKTVLKDMITKFTEEIKQTLEDKIITEEEAISLCKTIDNMLVQILEVFYKLSYENLLR